MKQENRIICLAASVTGGDRAFFSQRLVAWPSEEGGLRTEATSHLISYKNKFSIYYVALERFDLLALNMTDSLPLDNSARVSLYHH